MGEFTHNIAVKCAARMKFGLRRVKLGAKAPREMRMARCGVACGDGLDCRLFSRRYMKDTTLWDEKFRLLLLFWSGRNFFAEFHLRMERGKRKALYIAYKKIQKSFTIL